MLAGRIVLAVAVGAIAFGCAAPPDDTQEIVDNLVQAGFPADDIQVVGGVVYLGRDAEVSLAASREMLQTGESAKEQYRTNNLISPSLTKICVNGSTFTGVFSTALDLAIQNYDEQPLTFAMARTPSSGCSFTINAVIQPALVGGSAGFPAGGLPFGTITIGGGLSTFSVDTIEHVITHELGHTIGFRHSDFFNRAISCGSGGNEGDAGVGAVHIPGTPTGATVGGSLMNSCFRTSETGELTGSDVTALQTLYAVAAPPAARVPFFRYSNGTFHFYTASFAELGNGAAGYVLEGIAGFVSPTAVANTTPLFRYLHTPTGAHFYTTNFGELGNGGNGFVLEGIAAHMPTAGPGTTSFFRYVNVNNGDHFYTANFAELGNGAGGYILEGVQSLIFTSP
jgi:hypothetical protein